MWYELECVIGRHLPGCRTLAFGSTMSGFGSDASDMDICVFTEEYSKSRTETLPTEQRSNRNEANKTKRLLYRVRSVLS